MIIPVVDALFRGIDRLEQTLIQPFDFPIFEQLDKVMSAVHNSFTYPDQLLIFEPVFSDELKLFD